MPDIADEWEVYSQHFGPDQHDEEHAFYMGVMRGLMLYQRSSRTELRALAAELDDYLSSDPACICDECAAKKANGSLLTVTRILFGATQ